MLEALILACINWPTIWQKIVHWFTSSCMITTSSEQVVYIKYFLVFVLTFKTIYVHNVFWAGSLHVRIRTSMSNLLSYCGLVDARLNVSEEYLPVWFQFILSWMIYKVVRRLLCLLCTAIYIFSGGICNSKAKNWQYTA